ncbi:intracellular motility protein A [Corynebacterium accolens]|uniref:intracellular motility protein A n=1 Tax=Corynebacterium accolens TaxID=38284 RepID=UPI002542D391|nr:intracellular motility protein A [Corynebacterium accolens]MDK4274620.1 intracellular motility protein A [Corynebacterium accolens]
MKLNKRVFASAAISASLVATTVTPVAWAANEHLNCTQNFRPSVGADINVNVAEHLRRNCNLSVEQIRQLSVEDLNQVSREFEQGGARLYSEEQLNSLSPSYVVELAKKIDGPSGDDGNGPADGEQQSGPPLSVNEVKAGDREITGSVFLLPGREKIIQASLPGSVVRTKVLNLTEEPGGQGESFGGKVVTFTFEVPEDVHLNAGDEITVSRLIDISEEATNKDKPVTVIVKPADNDDGQAPGGGAGENPPMPPGDNENPPKPPAPGGGAGENPPMPPSDNENPPKPPAPGGGAGEGSSNFGNIFGVVAGLAGLAAVVAGIAKIFNPNSGLVRFLQPLRDLLAQFNIKF